jgi:MFS superfamily sulfate permease-like transporter
LRPPERPSDSKADDAEESSTSDPVELVWRGALSRPVAISMICGIGVILALGSLACVGRVVDYQFERASPALVFLISAPLAAPWLYMSFFILHARVVLTRTSLTWRLPYSQRCVLLTDVGEIVIAPMRVLRRPVDQAYICDDTGEILQRFSSPIYFDRADVRAILNEAGILIRRGNAAPTRPHRPRS